MRRGSGVGRDSLRGGLVRLRRRRGYCCRCCYFCRILCRAPLLLGLKLKGVVYCHALHLPSLAPRRFECRRSRGPMRRYGVALSNRRA